MNKGTMRLAGVFGVLFLFSHISLAQQKQEAEGVFLISFHCKDQQNWRLFCVGTGMVLGVTAGALLTAKTVDMGGISRKNDLAQLCGISSMVVGMVSGAVLGDHCASIKGISVRWPWLVKRV